MGAEPSSAPAPEALADVTVFCPTPLLTVTIEAGCDAGPELHVHAGGQGFWVARMVARLGRTAVLCAPFGGDAGRLLQILIADEKLQVKGVAVAGTNGSYVHDRRSGQRQPSF
jgi:1-phosphofructokinase